MDLLWIGFGQIGSGLVRLGLVRSQIGIGQIGLGLVILEWSNWPWIVQTGLGWSDLGSKVSEMFNRFVGDLCVLVRFGSNKDRLGSHRARVYMT